MIKQAIQYKFAEELLSGHYNLGNNRLNINQALYKILHYLQREHQLDLSFEQEGIDRHTSQG